MYCAIVLTTLRYNIETWMIYKVDAQRFHMYIIFTNPSAQAGYDTRSIFKRSLTGLNSEFSFS